LNDLWKQFCDIDEEVQSAALPNGDEYASRLTAGRKISVRQDNIASASGPLKVPRRIHNNSKDPLVKQVKRRHNRSTWLFDNYVDDAMN